MLKSTLIAGAGGFIGTVMRALCELIGKGLLFPLGTFVANICGCFLIGLFYGWVSKTGILGKKMNLFLITGLCGGFTTFSSMSDELNTLYMDGNNTTFWLYMGSSIILGIIAVAIGVACAPMRKRVQPQTAA